MPTIIIILVAWFLIFKVLPNLLLKLDAKLQNDNGIIGDIVNIIRACFHHSLWVVPTIIIIILVLS